MNEYTWKVLIVDDEPEIHTVTKLVLGKEIILGRKLEFLDAMNGEEAKNILSKETDIALILLDVVMSTDKEGLELARWIREDLKNNFVRIVLRTGNPGEAPEMEVITGYDINDYKEKSELTAGKLRSLFHTSLRNYRDLSTLERCRSGLARIITSLANLYKYPSLEEFTGGVLEQIDSCLFLKKGAMYGISSGLGAMDSTGVEDYRIVAGTGEYSETKGRQLSEVLSPELQELATTCRDPKSRLYRNDIFIQCMELPGNGTALLLLLGIEDLTPEDRELLDVFSKNTALAFRNLAERQKSLNLPE